MKGLAGGNETSCDWAPIEWADVGETLGSRLFLNLDNATTFDLPLIAESFRRESFFGGVGVDCAKARDVGRVFEASVLRSAFVVLWQGCVYRLGDRVFDERGVARG